MKNILIIAAAQTVLIALVVAGTWFMFLSTHPATPETALPIEGAEIKPDKTPKADPIYLSLDPAFVINLQDAGKMRFLQVQLEVMTRDKDVESLLDKYDTRIRNDLIFMFGALTMDDIRVNEGKATIQKNAREAINLVLKEEAQKVKAVEAVYFTKFVIQ